jgi:hypothetical protein
LLTETIAIRIRSRKFFLSLKISQKPRNSWLNFKLLEVVMVLRMLPEALKMLLSRIGRQRLSTPYCWLMLQLMETSITAALETITPRVIRRVVSLRNR